MPKPLPVAFDLLSERSMPPPLKPTRWRSALATGLCLAGLLLGAYTLHRDTQLTCPDPALTRR